MGPVAGEAKRETARSETTSKVPTPPNTAYNRPVASPFSIPAGARKPKKKSSASAWLTFGAIMATMVWFGTVAFYVIKAGGFTPFLETSGATAIVAVTGLMLAPAALFWMVFAYIKRAYDVEAAIEPLQRQLALVTGQGGVAETRIKRFNDALHEQLSLLKKTGEVSTRTAEEAVATLKLEREELSAAQTSFATEINVLLNTMRSQSSALEQLVAAGQNQLSIMAQKSQDLNNTLTTEANGAEQRLTDLLTSITATLEEVDRVAAERAIQIDDLVSRIASQEQDLRAGAGLAASDVQSATSAILEATQRFKDLASDGRVEAEKLVHSLNTQADVLEARSHEAYGRISETKALLTTLAEMLSSTAGMFEKSASAATDDITTRIAALTDASTALENTATQVGGMLHGQLEIFGSKQGEIAALYDAVVGKLQAEAHQLSTSAELLATRADVSCDKVKLAMDDLLTTSGESINRYDEIASKAETQAVVIATNFNNAIERYASTARQLNNAATELQTLAGTCDATLASMAGSIDAAASKVGTVTTQLGSTKQLLEVDAGNLITTLHQLAEKLELIRAATSATKAQTVEELAEVTAVTTSKLAEIDQVARGAIGGLGQANQMISQQKEQISQQIGSINELISGVGDNLHSRVASVLTQVERSSETAHEMVERYLARADQLAPRFEADMSAMLTNFDAQLKQMYAGFSSTMMQAAELGQSLTPDLTAQLSQLAEAQIGKLKATGTALELLIQGYMAQVGEVTPALRSQAEAAVALANNSIRKMSDEFTQTMGSVESQARGLTPQLAAQFDALVQTQLEKLQQIAGTAQHTATHTAEQVSGSIRKMSDEFTQTMGSVESQARGLTPQLAAQFDALVQTQFEKLKIATTDADALVAGTLVQLGSITPTLKTEADKATGYAVDVVEAWAQMAGSFGQKIAAEKSGWAQLTSEQAGAFAATLSQVQQQLAVMKDTQAELNRTSQLATERLLQHNTSVVDLETRLKATSQSQQVILADFSEQMAAVVNTLGKQADYLQTQIATMINDAGGLQTAMTNVTDGTMASFAKVTEQLNATTGALTQLTQQATGVRQDMVNESETVIAAVDRVTQKMVQQLATMRAEGSDCINTASTQASQLEQMLGITARTINDASVQLSNACTEANGQLLGYAMQIAGQIELVQRASADLAHLGAETQATEGALELTLQGLRQQIDAASFTLGTLEDSIKTRCITLADEQQKVMASLTYSVGALEAAANSIVASGMDALRNVNDVKQNYQTVATFGETVLQDKLAELANAAAASEQTLARYVTGAGHNLSQLSVQQEQVHTLLSTLQQSAAASDERLSALADKITAVTVESTHAASTVLDKLDDASSQMVGSIAKLADAASSSAGTLRNESFGLRREAESVGDTTQAVVGKIGQAYEQLLANSRAAATQFTNELTSTLGGLSQAQTMYEQMAQDLMQQNVLAKEMIGAIAGNFGVLLQTTQQTMQQLRQELETSAISSAGTLDQSSTVFAEHSQKLTSLSEKMVGVVESLGTQTGMALSNLKLLSEQLEGTYQRTGTLAEQTQLRLAGAAQDFETRQHSLAAAVDATASKFTTASHSLTESAAQLISYSGEIEAGARMSTGKIAQLQQETAQIASALEREADRIAMAAGKAVQQTDKAGQMLQVTSDGIIRTLDGSASKIEGAAEAAVTMLEREAERFRTAASASEAQLLSFSDIMSAKAVDFMQVSESMAHQAGKVAAQVQSFTGKTLQAVERLEAAENAMRGTAGIVADKLGAATTGLGNEIAKLDERAKHAVETLSSSNSVIIDQAVALQQQAQLAESQVQAVGAAVADLRSRTSTLRTQMEGDVQGLTDALSRALAELESTGDALYRHGQQAQQTVAGVGSATQTSARQLAEAAAGFRSEQEQMAGSAKQTLAETARVLGEFYSFKNQLTSQVNDLAEQLDGIATHADTRVRGLGVKLQGVLGEMMAVDEALGSKLANVTNDHSKLRAEVERSLQTMGVASQRLRETTSDATAEMTDLAERLNYLRGGSATAIGNQVQDLKRMVESATLLINELGTQLEQQVLAVNDAGSSVATSTATVHDRIGEALAQLQSMTAMLDDARISASLTAGKATRRMAEILADVEEDDGDLKQVG